MTTVNGMYTLREAAEYIGISHEMMRTIVSRQKRIRGVMVGRTMLFHKSDLDAYKQTRKGYSDDMPITNSIMTSQGDYQRLSRRTYTDIDCIGDLAYPALGLVNEAGEVAGKIKKIYRDNAGLVTDEHKEQLKGELGDVLWYLTQLATNLGLSLEEIAEANITKLYDRLERGVIGGSGDNR